jgi:hypothetical protein
MCKFVNYVNFFFFFLPIFGPFVIFYLFIPKYIRKQGCIRLALSHFEARNNDTDVMTLHKSDVAR